MCVSMCIRRAGINWLLHILVWNDHELKISVCMYATCNNEDTQTLRRFFHVSVFSGGFDHFILEVALAGVQDLPGFCFCYLGWSM